MNIAIFGTGNMASGLAALFDKAGHNITLASREPVKAQTVAAKLGTGIGVSSLADAAGAADAVVLAVPYEAAANVVEAAGDLAGKIVIDITNPLTVDFSGLTIGHTTSAAEEIQKRAPEQMVLHDEKVDDEYCHQRGSVRSCRGSRVTFSQGRTPDGCQPFLVLPTHVF